MDEIKDILKVANIIYEMDCLDLQICQDKNNARGLEFLMEISPNNTAIKKNYNALIRKINKKNERLRGKYTICIVIDEHKKNLSMKKLEDTDKFEIDNNLILNVNTKEKIMYLYSLNEKINKNILTNASSIFATGERKALYNNQNFLKIHHSKFPNILFSDDLKGTFK